MARIRSIHPGLFTDEAFACLSMAARVLLVGIWTECDDQGVFAWKPITLKMRIMPADNVDVAALLDELKAASIVRPAVIDGREYGLVRNFCKYQRPKFPKFTIVLDAEQLSFVSSTAVATVADDDEPIPISANSGKPPADGVGEGEKKKERKKDAASAAPHDPAVPERELFERGKAVLGQSAGGMITSLVKAKGGNVALARAAIEQSSTKQSPREYIAAIIKGGQASPDGKRLTADEAYYGVGRIPGIV